MKKLLHWHGLPSVMNKNKSIPQVLCAILYSSTPSARYCHNGKAKHRDIRDRVAEQLCAVITKEQAEELARAGKGNNAARKRSAIAILKSALTKQQDFCGEIDITRYLRATFRKKL